MRRLVSKSTPGKLAMLLVMAIVALASWLGAQMARTAAFTAQFGSLIAAGADPSPRSGNSSNTEPDVESLHETIVPPVGGSEYDNLLYLSKVTFAPDLSAPELHTHTGQFVLTVNAGAVCYEVGTMAAGATVTAVIPTPSAEHPKCTGSQTLECIPDDATGTSTCTLKTGDIIYLPASSSLTQNGDADHTYGNVDDQEAVVYLTGHQENRPRVTGCKGGCW